jgi:hypothetical protein
MFESEKKDANNHFQQSFDNETDRSMETTSQRMTHGAETCRTPGKGNGGVRFTP